MLITLALAPVLAAAAPQQPATVDIDDPKTLAGFLQSKGYRAELDLTHDDPLIRSGASGWNFSIILKGCEKQRACKDLLFQTSWDPSKEKPATVDTMNNYNRDSRFVRVYLDKDKAPVVEMDVIFTNHVMPADMLLDNLDVWTSKMSDFAKAIGNE